MEKNEFLNQIKINNDDSLPKYIQFKSEIERFIAENILDVNSKLPGEHELCQHFGLSRSTIRKSLDILEEAHLIYRVQGQGTFIGSKPVPAAGTVENKTGKFKKAIGVLLPNITNEIYPFIIQGIEQTVQSRNICVFSSNSGGIHEKELRLINELRASTIDGLIIEPLYSGVNYDSDEQLLSLLKKLEIPIVLINNDIPSLKCSKVMQDDECGGRLVTEHLLEHGHKRIAYIYNDRVNTAYERRKGYRSALKAAGIKPDKNLEVSYNDEMGIVYPGYLLTKDLLTKPELGITAIFYFNDDLALQGLTAAHSLNLHIPRDLSIVGYDDIPRSALAGIQLTTVSHPKALLGSLAASLLLEQFEQQEGEPLHRTITVRSSLVNRGSVAAVRP